MYGREPYEHMTVEIQIKDNDRTVARCSVTDHCIHDLDVHPDYRRCGYAKRLIDVLERNYDADWLWVKADNMEAVALYNNIGFKIVDIEEGYYKMSLRDKLERRP